MSLWVSKFGKACMVPTNRRTALNILRNGEGAPQRVQSLGVFAKSIGVALEMAEAQTIVTRYDEEMSRPGATAEDHYFAS